MIKKAIGSDRYNDAKTPTDINFCWGFCYVISYVLYPNRKISFYSCFDREYIWQELVIIIAYQARE